MASTPLLALYNSVQIYDFESNSQLYMGKMWHAIGVFDISKYKYKSKKGLVFPFSCVYRRGKCVSVNSYWIFQIFDRGVVVDIFHLGICS